MRKMTIANKKVFLTTLLVGLVIFFSSPSQALWLPGYEYRKEFNIEGSTGNVNDYQMELTVHKGSGADSGSNVYLNDVQDDFEDIRFTNSAGDELYYWIEDYVSGDYAKVWVQCDSIPSSPDTGDFYIYYNNPEATAGDSLTNDNLEQACNWYASDVGSTANWDNSYAYDGTHSLNWHIDSLGDVYGTFIGVKTRIDIGDWLDKGSSVTFRVKCNQSNHALIYGYWHSSAGSVYFTTLSQGATSNWGLVTIPIPSNAYKVEPLYLHIYSYIGWTGWTAGQSFDLWVDTFSFKTRKLVNPEPTFISWGSEENGVIPEPASLLLLGFGVVGITLFRKRIS